MLSDQHQALHHLNPCYEEEENKDWSREHMNMQFVPNRAAKFWEPKGRWVNPFANKILDQQSWLKKMRNRKKYEIPTLGSNTSNITRGPGGGGAWSPSGADLSPGGGRGQSPTGRDIAGTPFSEGGLATMFERRQIMARILPGGLTSGLQNDIYETQLQNNPEFAAKYFPNVVLNPPEGPLYNALIDLPPPPGPFNIFGPAPGTTSPKSIYETAEPKTPGPFEYMQPELPTKGAQFTAENVPYDTPDSVLDIQPSEHEYSYAYTRPYDMHQDVGSYPLEEEGEYSEPSLIPTTGGQSATIFMKPEMIADYGTDPKAPRNEMVPAPNWWPDKKATHVNQAEINDFIEEVASHEVSHNVSSLPEYEGINSLAQALDFKEIFPQFSSDEAQDVIKRLNILNEVGGGVYPPGEKVMKWIAPYSQYDFPPPDARSIKMGFKDTNPEAVNPKYTTEFKKRIKPFNLEPEYESTLIDYESIGEEELYNRAKDIYKIKKAFPNTYQKNMAYINNMKFINSRLSKFPHAFGKMENNADTYLSKKIEPAVNAYFERLTGGRGDVGGWSPSGADLSPGGGPGQSPTGRDIRGTPFSEGGLATMFERKR